MLTVEELIGKLAQYHPEDLVFIEGGEYEGGNYAQLIIAHSMQDYRACDGCVIMETE